MTLDGNIVQELQNALLSAFSADELTRLVRIGLNENLDDHTSGGGQTQVVFDLITWADRVGRLGELVTAAQEQNPGNAALNRFVEQHGHELTSSKPSTPQSASLTAPTESNTNRPLRVFLCHASEDKEAVRKLYHRLKADGMDPWLDEESLLPGQEWQREIPKAVRNADAVLVCLSNHSLDKDGYVQKETQFALDAVEKQPKDQIYLIPLRLEDCRVPKNLRRWHWVDLFDARGYGRLMDALRDRSEKLGVQSPIASIVEISHLAMPKRKHQFFWAYLVGAITLLVSILAYSGVTYTQRLAEAATATAEAAIGATATAEWPDKDDDRDGLSNREEDENGTLPQQRDTDEDGLDDGQEVKVLRTNPLNPDTDSDGVSDKDELSRGLDPLRPDTDYDGINDGFDSTPLTPSTPTPDATRTAVAKEVADAATCIVTELGADLHVRDGPWNNLYHRVQTGYRQAN